MLKPLRNLSLIAILVLLGACGEGFRGTATSNSLQQTNSQFFDGEGNRRSFTETNVDREILQSYANELQGRESATQNVSGTIRAFDLQLTADQNQNFTMRARIVLSCNEAYQIQSAINRTQMQNMQALNLGQNGPFQVEVRCTSSSCQELVAVIRKVSGSNQGTVLVGLAVGGQGNGEILYISRRVQYAPYFASFDHVQRFEQSNSCTISDESGPRSIGDVLTDTAVQVGQDLLKRWFEEKSEDFLDDLFN